jgi:hypothetical protein
MKARSKKLLERAIAAMVAAIEVYNKPNFPYRAESFTILATNAWELLLKAKWLVDHNHRLSALYQRQGGGKPLQRIKRTAAGNPMTHSLDYLAAKLRETKELAENAYRNLQILSELRDSAVHFYHESPQVAERLQESGLATVKHFHRAATDWFGENLSRYNCCLMPLAFVQPPSASQAVVLSREERRLLSYVSGLASGDDDPSSPYSVTVDIELRFVRSKDQNALPVRWTSDPDAPAVRLTEEQIRERYPWDYHELTRRCRQRYTDFKVDRRYHTLRKQLEADRRYAHIRYLDPANPTSSRKTFYNPNILQAFDAQYSRPGGVP